MDDGVRTARIDQDDELLQFGVGIHLGRLHSEIRERRLVVADSVAEAQVGHQLARHIRSGVRVHWKYLRHRKRAK